MTLDGAPTLAPPDPLPDLGDPRVPPRRLPAGLRAGERRSALRPLPAIVALVAEDLARAEVELARQLRAAVPAVGEINAYLAGAGGKRLRPLLTALGARAAGFAPADPEALPRLMCVGELVHLGSLLHDDVVDDGQERRGQPAAHRLWGNPASILSGDFCLGRAVWLAASTGGHRAVLELGHTAAAMAEGEVMQLLQAGRLDLDLATYFDIIDRKSAGLIAWCAAAGAWAAGEVATAEALARYGREVGIAFQISDDVLDYTGEKRVTGKRRGRDLEEGKPTLPLLLAMERVPDLRERLARGAPSPERVPALIDEVAASGALEDALAVARGRVEDGLAALDGVPASPWRDALRDLAFHLVERVR